MGVLIQRPRGGMRLVGDSCCTVPRGIALVCTLNFFTNRILRCHEPGSYRRGFLGASSRRTGGRSQRTRTVPPPPCDTLEGQGRFSFASPCGAAMVAVGARGPHLHGRVCVCVHIVNRTTELPVVGGVKFVF